VSDHVDRVHFDFVARLLKVQQEERGALFGAGKQDHQTRVGGEGNQDLARVEHPGVAVAASGAHELVHVGAAVGLGCRDGEEANLAAGNAR
jgi:hypothetical protein